MTDITGSLTQASPHDAPRAPQRPDDVRWTPAPAGPPRRVVLGWLVLVLSILVVVTGPSGSA